MVKLAIIIPAYNEERRISNMLREYCGFFSELKKKRVLDFEIIIVINNTHDKTEEIVREFQKKNREISYLNFAEGGKGFALTEGFKQALKRENDLIGFVDADMSTRPEAFYKLVENMGEHDGVIASRAIKGARANFSLKRKITHRGFNFAVKGLLFLKYHDTQCGAKVFKRKVIEQVHSELILTQWAYDVNLLYLCKRKKFKILEFPTVWEERGESGITNIPKVSLQMLLGVLRLRIIYSGLEPLARQMRFLAKIADKIINS